MRKVGIRSADGHFVGVATLIKGPLIRQVLIICCSDRQIPVFSRVVNLPIQEDEENILQLHFRGRVSNGNLSTAAINVSVSVKNSENDVVGCFVSRNLIRPRRFVNALYEAPIRV